MIRIGICDDSKHEMKKLKALCDAYKEQCQQQYEYRLFSSGEEVLEFVEKREEAPIDLLFLDVEMEAISGIEVKERVKKSDRIWRIVFVSGHPDSMGQAFGLKTLGFVVKPAKQEDISHWIEVVCEEKMESIVVELQTEDSSNVVSVPLEKILFFKAARNYTEVYMYGDTEGLERILTTKQIGQWESELKDEYVVRVHKSYLVNILNITSVGQEITLRDTEMKIPIGRTHRDKVKEQYKAFAKEKMRRRI